jgi:hypothetical protein
MGDRYRDIIRVLKITASRFEWSADMLWHSGSVGGPGTRPERDPGTPRGDARPGGGAGQARDPRLAWFAAEDGTDAFTPSVILALAAEAASGSGRRCPGATADERVGLVRAFAMLESWASAAKHGVIAEMIRRDDAPRKDGGQHGDLPDTWSPSLRHELALALACSVQSAETTTWLAWELQARLPGIRALLENGTLTMPKARAVIDTFKFLTDADTATAESLILAQLAGKTYPQVLRLAEEAALTVDPELAERRRLQAQKSARVTCFRELSGTAGLSGRDLPPDEALAAMAAVNARAQEYEDSGAFGTAPTDALRAYAYLDLLTDTPADDRIRNAVAQDESTEIAEALAWANTRAAREAAQERAEQESVADPEPEATAAAEPTTAPGTGADADEGGPNCNHDGRDDDGGGEPPADDDNGPGPGGPGPRDLGPRPGSPPAGRSFQRRPPDLIVPLATLVGLAERPGEVQGFGLLDPGLARDMAAAAAVSPRTEVCVTVTSPEGWAIGHGCARPERAAHPTRSTTGASPPRAAPSGSADAVAVPGGSSTARLPARLNLTVSATTLARLAARAASDTPTSPGDRPWSLIPRSAKPSPSAARTAGPPHTAGSTHEALPTDGLGTWTLVLPDGRRCTVHLDSVPTLKCDHQHASPGYHPGARLRHLVQVRDGVCTFPTCNRHAKESDFEHARPFEKGGATCACNTGARSRACHRVKQSPGWQVAQQPMPGWHQWTTPTGRLYTQGPKRYLA